MTIDEAPTPCFVCGCTFDPSMPGERYPYEGTIFNASGNYGSTAWDPMGARFLEINVCDNCLVERVKRVAMAHALPPVATRPIYEPWDPLSD